MSINKSAKKYNIKQDDGYIENNVNEQRNNKKKI